MRKKGTFARVGNREQRLRHMLVFKGQEIAKKLHGKLKSALTREGKLADVGDDVDIAADLGIDILHETNMSSLRRQILFLDEAISRLDTGTYGICDDCGEEIPWRRLEANPLAIRCVDCQEEYERSKNLQLVAE